MKKRSLWSRVLTILLVVCLLMTDQSASLFVEAVSAASWQQPGEGETLQQSNGETSEEIQEGGGEQSQENSGQEQQEQQEQQPTYKNEEGQGETPTVQNEELIAGISAANSSAAYGDQVILNGSVSDLSANLQWQYSDDQGNHWYDIAGETGINYTYAYTVENASYQYRLRAFLNEAEAYSNVLTITQSMTFDQVADAYYGENGTQSTASATISLISGVGEDHKVKAGDTFMVSIEYVLAAAALYNYGEQVQPLFDTYDETEIVLYLPEGMSVIDSSQAEDTLQGVTLIKPSETETGWTFRLNNSHIPASSDIVGDFQVAIHVDNNGLQETEHLFDFKDGESLMKAKTSITIKNRTNPDEITDGVTYNKAVPTASTFQDLTSTTDDIWAIEKSQSGEPVVDKDKTTVTFNYELTAGLRGENGIVDNPQSYARPGRVPFASGDNTIQLTEIPTVNDRDGSPLGAKSITVTPQFDNQASITVNSGEPISLPVDTCEGNVEGTDVASSAPYFSRYTVEVVYDYEAFEANYYDQNQDPLIVTNEARIKYRLAGEETDREANSSTQQETGYVTEPAKLTVEKYIVDNEGNNTLYSFDNFPKGDPIWGSAVFQIRTEKGEVPKLYQKTAENTYQLLEDANGMVTINPEGDPQAAIAGTEGTVTVYLDPGTYTISETNSIPANTEKITSGDSEQNNSESKTVTIEAGEDKGVTVDFYNQEVLGKITVQKTGRTDGSSNPLSGALFGLYRKESCTEEDKITEISTGSNGNAVFDRLPYGTYYVKEISAPEGYIIDGTVHTVTLASGDAEKTVSSVNNYNQARVIMQKWVLDVNAQSADDSYVKVDRTNYQEFSGSFSVEKKNSDGSWSPVENRTGMSPGSDGTVDATLSVYENDGKTLITYRFAETLPEGWHGAAGQGMTTSEDGKTVYSREFTLEDYLGSGNGDSKTLTVNMYNDQNGSIQITKNFYDATISGMSTVTDKTASFDLYYREGNSGTYTKYNESPYQVSAGGTITITDLDRTGTSGDRYYYLVEQSVDGYKTFIGEGKEDRHHASEVTITYGGERLTAYGPFNFTEGMNGAGESIELEQKITFDNVEQKYPVAVKKENSYTHGFVSGAHYAIYEYDESKENHQGVQVIGDTEIKESAGSFAELELGKKYLVVETVIPVNYEDVTLEENRIIDLTNVTEVSSDTGERTVTLSNRPNPTIRITKQLQEASTSGNTTNRVTALNGVQFEVYTKEGNEFVRAQYNGTPLTLTSGSSLQLPAGTYYLKEVVPEGNPNHVLDPSKYPDEYSGYDHELAGGSYYFGPYTVENQQDVQNLGTIVNKSQYGAVRVTKLYNAMNTSSDQYIPLAGAVIGIYNGNKLVAQGSSAAGTGFVNFTNLSVYDEEGNPITYTIREIEAPSGYTGIDTEIKIQLTPGTLTTETGDGMAIRLINDPVMTLNVHKTYYNVWEHSFTGRAYELQGAVIALYHWNSEKNLYEYVTVQETDSVGNAAFGDLNQREKYAAVEVCQPQGQDYIYLEPEEGTYLNRNYKTDGILPQTLTEEQMKTYYHVTKEVNLGRPIPSESEEMVNEEHWTQLQVKKYVIETEGDNIGQERLINNAQFELYQQIVDVSQGTEQELVFDDENCTLVGTYSSGTLYDSKGVRQDGKFATDILKSADNVVYWLVETNAGIGASIDPATAITLIKRTGTKFTNKSSYTHNGETADCTGVFEYEDDTVTDDASVQNRPEYGEGSAMFSTVRIAKWAGQRDDQGHKEDIFTPLGNATFDLYLADSNGGLHGQLDTLTTGLDNNLSNGAAQGQELSAWASSRAFSWTELTGIYKKEVEEGHMTQEEYEDIFRTDTNGNGYVRVAIVESNAPTGYMTEQSTYYMYMFFQYNENNVTEIFNDAYYVKENGDSGALDTGNPPLAEDQKGITWVLYPTEEQADGSYSKVTVGGSDIIDKTESQYRLVNWPIDNFAVTVQNYGYDPILRTGSHGLSTEELDEFYDTSAFGDRVALGNVTMKLERRVDGNWEPYAYEAGRTNGIFTVNANGYFAFPSGLNIGQYRITILNSDTETDPMAGYETVYDGSADERAYYFEVSADNVNISLYNPVKQDLTISKSDMAGESGTDSPVEGVTFTLTDTTDTENTVSGTTEADGQAALSDIGTGTYRLTENEKTAQNGEKGYTNLYFAKYFTEKYSGNDYTYKNENTGENTPLTDLVSNKGIFLGYTYVQETNSDGSQCVTVTAVRQISDYGIKTSQGIHLEIANPQTVDFTIKKTDRETGDGLSGAKFKVERLDFQNCGIAEGTGVITISGSEEGWREVGTYTTGTDGGYTYKNGEPGIYRITETQAPSNYDITDAEPKYLALTGGLEITSVTLQGDTPQKIDVKVTGNNGEDTSADADFSFADNKKVTLTVTKHINSGNLTVTGNPSFTFTLYGSNKSTVVGTRTVTLTGGADSSVSFENLLSQGGTYYLKETGIPEGYILKDIRGNAALTEDTDGFYKIVVPNSSTAINVTAENTYLWAEISVLKVDGNTGDSLSGAEFRIASVDSDGAETNLDNIRFTENPAGSGVYKAMVPLSSADGQKFHIYETKQPDNYLLNSSNCVEVTLTPGQSMEAPVWDDTYLKEENKDEVMLANRIFPNYRGAYIELTKYDNVRESIEAEPEKDRGILAEVPFILYRWIDNPEEEDGGHWEQDTTRYTDEQGFVRFTVDGGNKYAVSEGQVDGYRELEGLWSAESQTKVNTETANIEGKEVPLHIINNKSGVTAGEYYRYSAYNVPYEGLEIRKANVEPKGTVPTAVVNVYRVPENTGTELTQEEVTALMTEENLVIDNIQVDTLSQDGTYRYAAGDTRLNSSVVAGEKYLAVETQSSISQIRDNSQVDWYQVFTVSAESDEPEIVTLKNMEGEVNLSLAKTSEEDEFTSLLTQGAQVNYTITPQIGDNTYPLTGFILEDQGLTAFHEEGENGGNVTSTEISLIDKYTITQVTVGRASHDISSLAAPGTDSIIYATVIFKDFQGNPVGDPVKVNVSQSNQNVAAPEGNTKIASFSISYTCDGLQNATAQGEETGYDLGISFTPGAVQAAVSIDRQEGGIDVQSIDRIRNTARAQADYDIWTGSGVKEKAEPVVRTAVDDITFAEQDTAFVTVSKEAFDPEGETDGTISSAQLEDTIAYRINLTNDKDATASMENPFIVDLLPQGTSWVRQGEDQVELVTEEGSDLTISQAYPGMAGEENAVFVDLAGNLKPGETVTVIVYVKVERAVVTYGASMNNYVLAGSNVRGSQTQDNPRASSYKNGNKAWPGSIDQVLTSLPVDRIASLREILGEKAGFGYISDRSVVSWSSDSNAILSKTGYGDRDAEEDPENPEGDAEGGYTSDRLSTVDNGGTMYYRLSVTNHSDNQGKTDLSVIDILPARGDYTSANSPRGSEWSLDFDSITRVEKTNGNNVEDTDSLTENTDYEVYYYTGSIANYQNVYNASKDIKFGETSLPQGWTKTMPQDRGEITAFLVAANRNIRLGEDESLIIEYSTQVNGGEALTAEELNQIAYSNAANSFSCNYGTYAVSSPDSVTPFDRVLTSNTISATILPAPVQVGGRIWIDKNGDGVRDSDEEAGSFRNHTLVQDMLNNIHLQLNTYEGNDTGTPRTDVKKSENWNTIASYWFENLDSAALRDNVAEDDAYDENNELIISRLKGSSPSTYQVAADLTNVTGKFGVTSEGATNGRSRNPEGGIPAEEQTDSNFVQSSGTSTATSERFFLWSSSQYDMTKDLGLVLYRDLKITKQAQDDPNTKIEGAKFTVYGPFDTRDINSSDLTEENIVKNPDGGNQFTTDSHGQITVSDLLWYKYYVIVEDEASTGYELDSAQASATENTTNLTEYNGVKDKPAWILGIPDDKKDSSTENITVTNERKVDVTLEASKKLLKNGESQTVKAGEYSFILSEEPEGEAIQTKTNDGDGEVAFDTITLNRIGTFTYYIREVIPAEADRTAGVEYDDRIYKVVITTSWTDSGLTAQKVYQVQNEDDEWVAAPDGAAFTNEYKAEGQLDLTARKTVNGEPLKTAEAGRFIFTLTSQGNTPEVKQSKTNSADGTITFDPIRYDLDDDGKTYTYQIRETGVADSVASEIKNAYTPDSTIYTVTVTVQDKGDGTMEATPVYTIQGEGGETETVSEMVFDNTYTATGTWTPAGTKTLTGRDMAENETFSFEVVEIIGEKEGAAVSTGTASKGSNGIPVNISFTQVTYDMDDVGTHEYVIRETGKDGNGITLSKAEYKVEVTVSDQRDGRLGVAASYENGQTPSFENTYTADGSLTLFARKTINNKTPDNYKNSTFSFTLTPQNGAPGDAQTVQNTQNGEITFAPIQYSLSDVGKTYTYQIEETGDVPGYYSKDPTVYTAEVTVNDNGKGTLIPTVTYKADETNVSEITFNNAYTATGSLALTARKTVNDHAPAADEDGDFTFNLRSVGADTPSVSQTQTNKGGTITFAPIEYTLSDAGKTYTYQITESDTLPKGYEKDDRVYTVEVSIKDNGDGILTATPVYKLGDDTVGEISFNNIYTAETDLRLTAKKTVNGQEPENYQNSTFTFTLTPQNGAPGIVQTAQNDGKGNVAFEPITYSLEDAGNTYTYQVTESETMPQGYTRDNTVYTVNVRVEDNRDGSLSKTVTYTKPEEEGTGTVETEEITFDNTYTATGSWTPEGTKTLAGRAMAAGEEFTFTVKDQDNNTVSTGSVTEAEEGIPKNITFTPVNYTLEDAGKTYTYVISENKTNIPPGVEMAEDTFKVQVKVSDNGNGTLTAEPEYTNGAAAFVNTYKASNQLTIQAEKTVNGKTPAADEHGKFHFTLQSGAGTPKLEETVENAGSIVTFTSIKYDLEDAGKTYTYTLEEEDISGGYTKDSAVYTITVKITDDGDGELDLDTRVTRTAGGETTESGLDEIIFNNTYEATGTWTPKATKSFEGRDMQPGESFTFAVVDAENEDNVLSKGTVTAISSGQEKEITFEPLHYSLNADTDDTGNHDYLIIETTRSGDGITADTHKYPVTVTVTDNRDGTLNVAASNEGKEPVFENSYTASGSLEATAVKTVNGTEPAEDENQKFTFTLESGDGNTPTIFQEKENEGGQVTFDKITYSLKDIGKTYTYIVKESQTVPEGYTASEAEYRITVKITDNYDGTLNVDRSIERIDGEEPEEVQEIAFNNIYEATGIWMPEGTKALTGRDMREGEEFTFEVARLDGETETVVTTGKAEGGANSEAVDIQFTPITYTLTDAGKTYEYVIREIGSPSAGMTLDPTEFYVSVNITDNRDGTLKITPDYGESQPKFQNTYTVKPTTFTPKVEKLLTGADTPEDKTFYFTMEADRANLDGAQMGSQKAQVNGAGQTNFEPITFTQAGTYRFFITENQGSQEDYRGYTFDDTAWTLVVTVEDIDSQLTVNEKETVYLRTNEETGEKVSDDMAVFTNDYQVAPTDYQLQVTKTVTGDDRPSEETFRFNLTEILDENEGAQLPKNTSIEITGSGEGAFDNVHFTKAGTYRFEIREENTEVKGYSYDGSIWTVTVEVTDHDSVLEVTNVTYVKNGKVAEEAQTAIFENVYDTEAVDYTPVVTKKLTGDDRPVDKEKIFHFTIEAEEDNPEGAELTGTETMVQGAGHTSFDPIHFTKAGTYQFVIRESAGEENGYTYDSSKWVLTVTVEDVDSILIVTEEVYDLDEDKEAGAKKSETLSEEENSSEQENGAVFTNDYQVTETTWQPQVEKKVTGDMPENETFRFTLTASQENPEGVQLPENLTAEADLDKDTGTSGKVFFDEITFTKAGTYQFQIAEENTGKAGYTYDGNIWTVTVKVTDEDSVLTVSEVTYAKAGQVVENAEYAVFENVYETKAAAFTPTVKKTITGDKAPEEKVFWFTLEADEDNQEGAALQTAETSVKGEGSASFGKITFTKAGTYKFYLREKEGEEKGYTYDTSRWMLTITVTDKDSILTVEKAAYTKIGELTSNTEAAVFQNKYTADKMSTDTKTTTTKRTITKTTTTRKVKTGDTANVLPWIALMSASALAGAGVVSRKRKKNRR